MRKEKISHLPKKGSKSSSSFTLRQKLTAAFLLLSVPIYHQEVVLLLNNRSGHSVDILCEHTVLHELQSQKVKHVDIVLAQSILETGSYTSQLTRSHNNIFGFRTKRGYIKFGSWKECVAYYKKWQDKRYKNEPNYYSFLVDVGYAEDPTYTDKLRTIVKKMN